MPAWTEPLYTADVNPRERVYVCAQCSAETVLGEDGAPPTIEALKMAGCRICAGKVFRRRATGSSG
jgi:DNA-directed RNA polymerase subunit RPC12/RpoP